MATTKEDIWKIANDMVENGERPTLAAIRKTVGGGSYTTISEAMTEWRDRQKQAEIEKAIAIPDEISDTLLIASKSIWKVAKDRADKEVSGLKDELKAKQDAFDKERTETLTLADQLSQELELAKADNDKLKEEYKKHTEENQAI